MANFLIQTIDGQVKHDFSFALIEAIDFQNWKNKGAHDYYLTDDMFEHDFSKYVPSGTIQFIERFIATYHDVHKIKPINIPNSLMKSRFLKRNCSVLNRSDIRLDEIGKFVKSNDRIKGYTGITNVILDIPETSDNYVVSDLIEIESEWRAFVFNSQLVGLQNYSGDFTMFPDVKFINDSIMAYANSPSAYTLDVGINKTDGTFLIEVHNFFSCGLYGFNECKILPQMFIRSFHHLLKNGY